MILFSPIRNKEIYPYGLNPYGFFIYDILVILIKYEVFIFMIYNESGKVVDVLQDIISFNNKMNKDFKYGLAINGAIDSKRNISSEDYDKLYRVVNAKQFEKQQGGVCWDYVIYEADYFKKNFSSVKIKAWYIIWDKQPDYPTHTFITFKMKNKYISMKISLIFLANEDVITLSAGANDSQKDNDLIGDDIFGD